MVRSAVSRRGVKVLANSKGPVSTAWNDPHGTGSARQRHDDGTHSVEQHRNRQESLRILAKRYGIDQKTVAKRKAADLGSGSSDWPLEPKSAVLSLEEEAVIVAFRKHTLMIVSALQPTIPH